MTRLKSIKDKAYFEARVISWDSNVHKLKHRLESWIDLRNPAFILSPYEPEDTFKFVAGLIEIEELSFPKFHDIVLVSMADPSTDEIALDYISDCQRAAAPVICDLATMDDVRSEQVMGKDNYKDIPVWTGNVGVLDDYVARKYARDIYADMNSAWRSGAFTFAVDRGDTGKNLTNKRTAVLLEVMSLGRIDMSGVTKLLTDNHETHLDNINGLNLNRDTPDWIVEASNRASDVLALWSYAAKRERIRMSIPMEEIVPDRASKRFARLADMLGMENMLETYAAGVPVDDLTA